MNSIKQAIKYPSFRLCFQLIPSLPPFHSAQTLLSDSAYFTFAMKCLAGRRCETRKLESESNLNESVNIKKNRQLQQLKDCLKKLVRSEQIKWILQYVATYHPRLTKPPSLQLISLPAPKHTPTHTYEAPLLD